MRRTVKSGEDGGKNGVDGDGERGRWMDEEEGREGRTGKKEGLERRRTGMKELSAVRVSEEKY